MDRPLVSVIIPCWNGETVVGEAIESALAQTYPDVEVIVIDDGSTDGSLEVIGSFGDRIRWETGPNRGACAARNRGLELARGDLIQFLDVDDLLYPRKLELQVPVSLKSNREIFYCDRETFCVETPERKWFDAPSEMTDQIIFALTKIIHTATPLYQRTAIQEVGGYREELDCAQDYDFHLRLAMAGWSYRRVPEVLVTVRRRSQSVSSDSLKVLDRMLCLYREVLAQLRQRDALTHERRATIAAQIAAAGRVYLRAGRRKAALDAFEEARCIDPAGAGLAYGRATRLAREFLGPVLTEYAVTAKRRIFNRSYRPR